tara:strand:+ start:99 stop:353 length:255 start_codon:yes stop_codon:yes gene_type:complete
MTRVEKRNNKIKGLSLEFKAEVLIDYKGIKGNKFLVTEICGNRITLDIDGSLTDFINREVKLLPQYYSQKEFTMITNALNNKIK